MPIFAQYVIWEVSKVFSLALAGLTLITTLGMGVREGLRHGFPLGLVFQVMPFMLPEILGITLPVAVLLAVTQPEEPVASFRYSFPASADTVPGVDANRFQPPFEKSSTIWAWQAAIRIVDATSTIATVRFMTCVSSGL